MARLSIHNVLKQKLASGEKLTQTERMLLRAEYKKEAEGVSYHDSFIDFIASPRDTLIPHVVRVWTTGWLLVRYTRADEIPGTPLHVLDIGAGRGELGSIIAAMRLAKHSRFYYKALDLNLERAELFNDVYADSDRMQFIVHDARDPLPFENDTFDAVACIEFLEHVTQREAQAVLREIGRVMKPGAHAVISSPDAGFVDRENKKKSPYHVYEWAAEELKAELQVQGWNIRDQFWFFVPMKSLIQYFPRFARGRMSDEWLKAVLSPASGARGNIVSFVLQKPEGGF